MLKNVHSAGAGTAELIQLIIDSAFIGRLPVRDFDLRVSVGMVRTAAAETSIKLVLFWHVFIW